MVALKKSGSRVTYKQAGVDIDAADKFVTAIAPIADATVAGARRGTLGGLGGYGALFDMRASGFNDPILVSSTDGVGTKLRIAIETGIYDTIGVDLVAMCVNDILVHGAEPLFFLDYFACEHLEPEVGKLIVAGIAKGCEIAGCALVGGETAEMPGFYKKGDFDLGGFVVGAVERGQLLPRLSEIKKGDVLVGLASSGVHSNGFSFVREMVALAGLPWSSRAPFEEKRSLGEALLEPTRIYVKSLLPIIRGGCGPKALAHITGSGHVGKLQRVLPADVGAHIKLGSWVVPPVFGWLRDAGGNSSPVDERELLSTFNCGIGMVLVVDSKDVDNIMSRLQSVGETASVIGELEPRESHPVRFTGSLRFAR